MKDLIESEKSSDEIVRSIIEDFDNVIKGVYLDFRQDHDLNHDQAVAATSEKLNTAESDIEDTLKRLKVDTE